MIFVRPRPSVLFPFFSYHQWAEVFGTAASENPGVFGGLDTLRLVKCEGAIIGNLLQSLGDSFEIDSARYPGIEMIEPHVATAKRR